MKKRLLCGLAAAALMFVNAHAEPVKTEYLVDMQPDEVYALEQRLGELGYLPVDFDEVYDADTRLAIESFQQANQLEVTGSVNDVMMKKLNGDQAISKQDYLHKFSEQYAEMTPLKNGNINSDVSALQKKLKEYGYFTDACDGVFGDATQLAVEKFQAVNGLTVTGIANGATMMRLSVETPMTWQDYLVEMSSTAGDSGLNVYVLQKKLQQMGYFDGDCTGNFGDLTQRAVLAFQTSNELVQTGFADAATWAAIYSKEVAAPIEDAVIRMGDFGDNVQQAQQKLTELGYFTWSITGEFGSTTATAVRLFQMANELTASGEIDADTLDRLNGGEAKRADDAQVQQGFQDQLATQNGSAMGAVAEIANHMLGTAFESEENDLYPGFTFVQYVCVAAGLPVSNPEALIRLTNQRVENVEEVAEGDVVVFQNATGDAVNIQCTICVGDGKIIYASSEGGWVVVSSMSQMEDSNVYCWGLKVEAGE